MVSNFVILTDTPGRLAAFLVSHDIIQQNSNGSYKGVLPGMEWVEVPNPIVTGVGSGTIGQPDFVQPPHDTRRVYLVKFTHESENQKAEGFRDWILNNSSVVTAPVGWTINGDPVGSARKVTGEQVWLAHVDPERFGAWQ